MLQLFAIYFVLGLIIGACINDERGLGLNGWINSIMFWPAILIVFAIHRYNHWRNNA